MTDGKTPEELECEVLRLKDQVFALQDVGCGSSNACQMPKEAGECPWAEIMRLRDAMKQICELASGSASSV